MNLNIKTVILEKDAESHPFAKRAVERLPDSCSVLGQEEIPPQAAREEFDFDKNTLRLLSSRYFFADDPVRRAVAAQCAKSRS